MNRSQRLVIGILALSLLSILGLIAWLLFRQTRLEASEARLAIPSAMVEEALPALPLVSPTQPTPPAETIIVATLLPEPTPITATAPLIDCVQDAAGGLMTDLYTIVQAMPGPGSQGMRLPSDAEMRVWERLVLALTAGDTIRACELIAENAFPYELLRYVDVRNENQVYWLLRERSPITAGWGTYIIRSEGVRNEVIVEVPHPVADWRTDPEGVAIFRALGARALLVAGTHRCANSTYSPCSGQTAACGAVEAYRSSDVAHAVQSMFQAAHTALVPCGGMALAIQLHANDLTTCPDLFLSNGTSIPGVLGRELMDQVHQLCPDYTLDLADGVQPECAYNSGNSVQARYSNGCGLNPPLDACTATILSPSNPEQFFSMEQSTFVREDFTCLVAALEVVFP